MRHETATWLRPLARIGLAAKGVVYLTLGMLAMRLATGQGGAKPDAHVAFGWLAQGPFGTVLLAVIAAGLFAYAAWRLAEAATGRETKKRVASVFQGGLHAFLAIGALSQLQGRPTQGDAVRRASGEAMAWPGGEWLVGAAGVVLLAVAAWQLVRAWRGDATRDLDLSDLGARAREAIGRLGAAGLVARGMAFGLIGAFLGQAALHQNGGETRGPGAAIAGLLAWPHGPWLVALVALGFMAYGLFMFVAARRRRLPGPA